MELRFAVGIHPGVVVVVVNHVPHFPGTTHTNELKKKNTNMRYLLFILLLIVEITKAQGIIFEKNLDDVFKKAKAENKLVFIE
jgi:accessory gene regulator protein AgrB